MEERHVLNFGIEFHDLYKIDGIKKIDTIFNDFLYSHDIEIYKRFVNAKKTLEEAPSDLILKIAPLLDLFLVELFKIDNSLLKNKLSIYSKFTDLYDCKRNFIQRKIYKLSSDFIKERLQVINYNTFPVIENDYDFVKEYKDCKINNKKIDIIFDYAIWAINHKDGVNKHKGTILFSNVKKVDKSNLLEIKRCKNFISGKEENISTRDRFHFSDKVFSIESVLNEIHYCLKCHKRNKDSCSKGSKKDFEIKGCPLEEHISEMITIKESGHIVGSLAIAMINNPMIAATGHRICNDCMNSCIYQKQEPVNVPKIETQILNDVLYLPWGFEIYSLMTRWLPLKFESIHEEDLSEYKVLIVGMGPAGFTLSYHLLRSRISVVGVDALKIEPLSQHLISRKKDGNPDFDAITNVKDIFVDLDDRFADGFGGVMEYGITARWNKNYLKIIRIVLERNKNFSVYGGIRFGSNISYNDTKDMGFDHIALCMGSGSPNIIDIPNMFCSGIRMASDFLMTLQLTRAESDSAVANLDIKMPVIVIGGGLTAIDVATEALAYYPVMVEKILKRYEILGKRILKDLSSNEKNNLYQYIYHAEQLRISNREKKLSILQSWGGVKILYRKNIEESPSYRFNHNELQNALDEGVVFLENHLPTRIETNQYDEVSALYCENKKIEARTVLIAIGTKPNNIVTDEYPELFSIKNKYIKTVFGDFICHINKEKKAISFFGDMNPKYYGSVVNAMASSAKGHKDIINVLKYSQPYRISFDIKKHLYSIVRKINMLSNNIIELVLYSPLAAKNFLPGQFYKLQNYRFNSDIEMEPIALTGSWANKEEGTISLIILVVGGSSNICRDIKLGERIYLMGPTGSPTFIPRRKNVMLVGGGLGNAVLFSVANALKNNGCKIIYFAGYKNKSELYKIENIKMYSDIVIWGCEESMLFDGNNKNEYSYIGNMIEVIHQYSKEKNTNIKLSSIDHMIVVGSNNLMGAIAYERYNLFKNIFDKKMNMIASINSPMQCMAKKVCGQCIQRHYDKSNNKYYYLFSCNQQYQNMDLVDFNNLASRLSQNKIQEIISSHWISYMSNNINQET